MVEHPRTVEQNAAEAARDWAAANEVEGQVLTLEQASERGTADWRDCCDDCDCR